MTLPYLSNNLTIRYVNNESSCLGLQLKVGGKFHLKLNIGGRPIANKYREGKMQRTLKRELKVPEIAEREAKETSVVLVYMVRTFWCVLVDLSESASVSIWGDTVFLKVISLEVLYQ